MKIKGIRYTGPIFDSSGYAKACRGNILALHKAGVPITLNPMSFDPLHPPLGTDGDILLKLVNNKVEFNVNLIHSTPEFWAQHRVESVLNLGYTIWETTKLHPDWPKFINKNVDKVLVGCDWNVNIFKESGVTIPIGVVPHGINVADFNNVTNYSISGLDKDTFVFYSIFQWQERKHPLALIKAYWHAFTGNTKVALVLKTYRSSYDNAEKDAIRMTIKRLKEIMPMDHYPKIILILNMLSEDEINGLHRVGDCYTSLDRGEGFGLSPFTAGAIGNPIVITGFGGSTEYAKEDNSYLIDYNLTPVYGMPWARWYQGTQCWAEPNIIDGANKMKYVYEHFDEAKEKGNKLKQYITENFSWEVIANKIIKEIEEI